MISEDYKEEVLSEVKEYEKACTTVKAIINLFDMTKRGGSIFGPDINLEKNIDGTVYSFNTKNVLVGHVEVEANFTINVNYLDVHKLASNKGLHSSIRRTLEHFLSVYEREEVKLPETF